MKFRLLAAFLAVVLLSGMAVTAVQALPKLQDTPVTVTVAEGANLRAGPGTSFARVGGVDAGDKLQVVGCNADCSWYKTASAAWIAAELVEDSPALRRLDGDAVEPAATVASGTGSLGLPTITPPIASPASTAKTEGPVASANANLRSGPGTYFERVGSAQAGDALKLTGQNPAGDWLQLADGSWVASFLVQNVGKDLPIVPDLPKPPAVTVTATLEAEATPTPEAADMGAAGEPELAVEFINPHYNCEFGEYIYEIVDGAEHKIWAYRSFQIDMFITNNGSEAVETPWQPTRWIITDGQNETVNDLTWQWRKVGSDAYEQPVIYPGQKAGWTWVAMPVAENEWVKAVEFYYNGHVYRQAFDLGPYHNAYNYIKCNEYVPAHKEYATPTPVPLWGD